ncbi:MAG: CobW family GTP-binding protein [Aquabacterium sp.]
MSLPPDRAPLPLVIIGGWLGAGKTTLVNHLLRHADGRRIAVLVNDFGSVSIDADLIEGAADEVLALAGGCICCSFGADLVGTLMQVVRREPAPDVVVVECSGVGLPAAVARSAALALGVRVDGIAVLVDAADVRRLAQDPHVGDVVRDQIAQADLLLVNQIDRLPALVAPALQAWLAGQAPGARQLECERGAVPPELLLGLKPRARPERPPRAWAPSAAPAAQRFAHFPWQADAGADGDAVVAALRAAQPALLRAKGTLSDGRGGATRLHLMGPRTVFEAAPAGTPADGRIAGITLAAAPPPRP